MALLKAVEGPLQGQSFKIPEKDRVVVGRYEIYDLVVPDASISRKHFALEQRADGTYLVDLGSLNGTQLNGHRVSTAKLETGDRISAGQTVLEYNEAGAAGAAPKIEMPVAPASQPPEAKAGGAAEEVVVEVLPEVDGGAAGEEVVEVLAEVAEEPQGAAGVEALSDADIVFDPASAGGAEAPQTVPMGTAAPEPAEKGRRVGASGSAQTKRTARDKDGAGKKGSGKSSVGRCAACGRKVTSEDLDSGAAEKVPQGYVCERCVKKHADSGGGTTLEQFVVERKRRRRRR